MPIIVRAFRPEDAEDVAAVHRAAVPHQVRSPEAVVWDAFRSPAAMRRHRLVAVDEDGRVTGCADTGIDVESAEPGHGFLLTEVRPDARGRGAGQVLTAAAETRLASLGVTAVHSRVADDGCSPGFAERRGYLRGGPVRYLALDLAEAVLPEPRAPLPPGTELRTAAAFTGDLRPLYEADVECVADEPGDMVVAPVPFEDWLLLNWARPDFDADLTTVALVDGAVAAYSVAQVDGRDRYWSGMTGTRRAFRGRGLARLAKTASLRRARAAGYRHAFTGNDADNRPMLAVNARLGYRPAAMQWRCVKRLPPR
ncbi:GNAT family N-acetyltransferase [Streptomyces sp. RKND-216]|uniref:GNAT family N-acetyltransferase n=1 Tax=Streptomyces sp. RKND-216 TaxID=2562581 RepID=UPI00109DE19D|nr:GNAT family N-acetyltransferase [Streptomyces sp. RKND-216]THA27149.1 GNAT family N-acetyltransferase [Streptomyces sp. RKND-216]